MQTAEEIVEQYACSIKQANDTEGKAQAKTVWDKVYDQLPDANKTEIKALLKQRATAILSNQQNLNSRIVAAGFADFETFFE